MPKTRAIGRPATPPGARLQAYGLHLSPDKKEKLFAIKTYHKVSVREWIEEQIEIGYERMRRVARRKAG
jgi:hypothetical protein